MTQWVDKADCEVVIDETRCEPRLKLVDADGDVLFEAPPAWGEDDVWYALRIANTAFDLGHRLGSVERVGEIQKALGLVELWRAVEVLERSQEAQDCVIRQLGDRP